MTDGNRATEKITFPRVLYILVLLAISSLLVYFYFLLRIETCWQAF